ncbi:MAG TPA: hypothetical protein VHM20_02935, partial [Gammaproteobacteria bacterium]|nr:hypothetical protein [Gammaproteobacteria bacterium]
KDTNRLAQQLLEKQRADWCHTLKKKQGKTDDMCAKFGDNWKETVAAMIARTDEMLALFKLQWNFDHELKRYSNHRQTVMTIFNNYIPRLNGMFSVFSGKHTENICEARNIVHHLEKNPDIDYGGIVDLLLNVGQPTNHTGEFNRRLNYCFNVLSLTHKRLSMSNLPLIVTPVSEEHKNAINSM